MREPPALRQLGWGGPATRGEEEEEVLQWRQGGLPQDTGPGWGVAGRRPRDNPSPLQPSPAACSHQCFKRSPCPVPAAVWVLLGKLAMACKLGTPPPTPLLSSSTYSPPPSKPSLWRLT